MRNNWIRVFVCVSISFCFCFLLLTKPIVNEKYTGNKPVKTNKLFEPGDFFSLQRSWPDREPDFRAYEQGINSITTKNVLKTAAIPGFNAAWTLEGPANIGGRVNVVLVHPTNSNIQFAGCATGGIFRTTDGGVSWLPVFDNQPFLSIGCLAFEPGNPSTIFAGTGDPNISGYPFIGDGIWKSMDGGDTWVNIGLTNERIISKIVINPANTNIIYAATMGLPFVRNNDRGLYKSTDGGNSWNQVLFISNDAGIIDLVMDPNNPDVLFAAGWNRIRNNQESLIIGQAAKIYKTTDGGANWNILTSGLPSNDMSRIGLAMSKTSSNVIYAAYVNDQLDFDGVYKSTDGGNNWTLQNGNGIDPFFMGGFGWYFGRIEVNPVNDNQIFICGVDIYRSGDGGNNWIQSDVNFDTHADKHDVCFINATTLLLATDGGIYKSLDGGNTWTDSENIPNSQFYRVAVNPFVPGEYSGGLQDNGTVSGSASNINNWQRIFGGDGFTNIYDPVDPLVFYMETQNGDIWATSDGGVFVDYISGTIDGSDRRNWDMQYIQSVHNHNVLYTGTYRVYKNSSGPVDDWIPISPDLTDGLVFEPRFHTISTVAESPVNPDYIYAGTSDGNVWRSTNGGSTWDNITGTLPDRYVTSVKASPNNQNELYVTVSGYKYNEYVPHVFKSTDNGTTWTDISGNLPQLAVNEILLYPGNSDVLMVATDGGVYASLTAGNFWDRVGANLPVVPVYDMELDLTGHKIIAGTHARSMFSYPLDSILISTGFHSVQTESNLQIFPIPAERYLNLNVKNTTPVTVKIFNFQGSLVKQFMKNDFGVIKVDISEVPSGIYFMEVVFPEGSEVKKFVKV